MMQKVYVYFHRNALTDDVFYVGIGVKFRPYRTSGRSVLWNRVVLKYGLKVEIVHTFTNWEDAKVLEKKYIADFGRLDNKTGCLVNHTDGGDGALGNHTNFGRKASEETKAKQSAALKGKPIHPNTIAARKLVSTKGRTFVMSEEQKIKISNSKKGSRLTEEAKKKISEKHKGRVFSDETRRKNSESLKKHVKTEEHRRKLSEATKRYYALKKLAA